MALVSIFNKLKWFLFEFVSYAFLALIFFVPYIYQRVNADNLVESINNCSNIKLLCAPLFYNNLLTVFENFFVVDAANILSLSILFVIFLMFWLRLLKFRSRMDTFKYFALLLLLTSPDVLWLLTNSPVSVLTVALFIMVSLGFETINHGLIVRGLLLCSSFLPLLLFNGTSALMIGLVTPSFLYFMVKWHILKKYTIMSYILLLFPSIILFFGVWYLNGVYAGSLSNALVNSNVEVKSFKLLLNWYHFTPLFLIYYFKHKKGLNQIKRFIIPIFFFANFTLLLLEISHTQREFFGMCILAFSFEVVSDPKFRMRSISYLMIFALLAWLPELWPILSIHL